MEGQPWFANDRCANDWCVGASHAGGEVMEVVPPDPFADVLPVDPWPDAVEAMFARIERDEAAVRQWALSAPPSLDVAAVLSTLEPQRLPGDERVQLIQAWERLSSWVAAQQQAALAAVVDATEGLGLPGHLARHEVGAALRLSPGPAYDRCRRAQEIVGRLAPTLRELDAGRISPAQATLLADAVHGLDDDVTAAVQQRVLARARFQTPAQTRQSLRRAVAAIDTAGAAERAADAYAERTVTKEPLDNAMTEIRAVLAATDAERVWRALDERAASARTKLRTSGQPDTGVDALRADALVGAILESLAADPNDAAADEVGASPACAGRCGRGRSRRPRRGPAPAQVHVSVDLATLLGLADQPGELAGYGPIRAPMARELAADGEWVRWTTDPQTAQLLDPGARTYRPSPALAEFIRAAYPRCAWLGCRQPAARCDLDHIVDFHTAGGSTTRGNLGPLCRQHHNAKTHGRWQYTRDPNGTGHLTSPLGRAYEVPPPRDPPEASEP